MLNSTSTLSRSIIGFGFLLSGFLSSGAMHCSGPCPDIGPVVVESYGWNDLSRLHSDHFYLVTLEEPEEVTMAFEGGFDFRLTSCGGSDNKDMESSLDIEGGTPFETELPLADCYRLDIDFHGMAREASVTVRTVLDEPVPGGMSQGAHGQYCPPPRVWHLSLQSLEALGVKAN